MPAARGTGQGKVTPPVQTRVQGRWLCPAKRLAGNLPRPRREPVTAASRGGNCTTPQSFPSAERPLPPCQPLKPLHRHCPECALIPPPPAPREGSSLPTPQCSPSTEPRLSLSVGHPPGPGPGAGPLPSTPGLRGAAPRSGLKAAALALGGSPWKWSRDTGSPGTCGSGGNDATLLPRSSGRGLSTQPSPHCDRPHSTPPRH